MEVARTSMIHAAAPHFLSPFAVRYAAHQLNLWPRVSLPETLPTLRWMGNVGNGSVFRVWGSHAFVRDTSADKLSSCAIPYVFLGFPPDPSGWQFYHPTSRRVLSSQDVTIHESIPFYHLFPYRTPPPPPRRSFLLQLDPLPLAEPVKVTVDSGAARGAASGGAASGGAESGGAEASSTEPGGAEPEGADPGGADSKGADFGGAEPGGAEPGGTEPEGAEPGGAESEGAEFGGAEPRGTSTRGTGAAGAGGVGGAGARDPGAGGSAGASSPGGAGVTARAGGTGGAGAAGPGGARTRGTGAVGAGGVGGTGAGDPGAGATGAGAEEVGAGGAGAGGTGAGDPEVGGAGALGVGAGSTGARGTVQWRPFFFPSAPSSLSPRDSVLRQVLTPLPSPPASSLAGGSDPESDLARAASPTVTRLLATIVTNPSFESTATSALVAELVDIAAACRLNYATSLVAESESNCPPSVGGESALGTDVLEDRQEDFECLAAAIPHLVAMLLAYEGDLDTPDILTPRSYAEAITSPYSSQWQTAIEAEMASWKSTGTYVDAVPPPGVNIVDGMWIFRVKRPPGSPPILNARYVARCFSQRQGRDYELHSLEFSIAFLQGSLHEEIWLRCQPDFTGLFPAGTHWSLWRPLYGLRQAPRE
ncbi:unnamed protein product [Closterium sp. NIES-53]